MYVSKYCAKRSVWRGGKSLRVNVAPGLSVCPGENALPTSERKGASKKLQPRHSGEQPAKLTMPGASRATPRAWQSTFPGEFAWLAVDRASVVALSGFAVTSFPPLLTHRHFH